MFTGLVAEVGEVVSADPTRQGARLRFRAPEVAPLLVIGDSVSVSGTCLTATEASAEGFAAEAVAETLRRTNLGGLTAGCEVNLEPALRVGDRLGGHIVQGHVDGLARVLSAREEGESTVLRVGTRPDLLRYVVEKGSVALDGVSLTVASRAKESFEVALIPHTMVHTTLGPDRVDQDLNLEVDALARYVEALTVRYSDRDPAE